MKRALLLTTLFALMALGLFTFAGSAAAEETKMVGVVTKIELAGQEAKSATVTLKDNKSEEAVVIIVNDDLTLDKFKDHRIVEGDEIRCKYEVLDGKKTSRYFRKTAGC